MKADLEKINEWTEHEAYFFIDFCGYNDWLMRHEYYKGDISEKEWEKIEKSLKNIENDCKKVLEILHKFGVENAKAGSSSESYRKWYYWWKNWKDSLDEKEWKSVQSLIGSKLTEIKPKGTWR